MINEKKLQVTTLAGEIRMAFQAKDWRTGLLDFGEQAREPPAPFPSSPLKTCALHSEKCFVKLDPTSHSFSGRRRRTEETATTTDMVSPDGKIQQNRELIPI